MSHITPYLLEKPSNSSRQSVSTRSGASTWETTDPSDVPPPAYEERYSPPSNASAAPKDAPHTAAGSSYMLDKPAGPPMHISPYAPPPDAPSSSKNAAPSMHTVRSSSSTDSGAVELLNPPPASFARTPPPTLSYAPFPPTALLSYSSDLVEGFPGLAPPSILVPHPFAAHDVNEGDWLRFLGDMQAAAHLAPGSKFVATIAPAAMRIPLPLTGTSGNLVCGTADT